MLNRLEIGDQVRGMTVAEIEGRHSQVVDADCVVEILDEPFGIVICKDVAKRRGARIGAGADSLDRMTAGAKTSGDIAPYDWIAIISWLRRRCAACKAKGERKGGAGGVRRG